MWSRGPSGTIEHHRDTRKPSVYETAAPIVKKDGINRDHGGSLFVYLPSRFRVGRHGGTGRVESGGGRGGKRRHEYAAAYKGSTICWGHTSYPIYRIVTETRGLCLEALMYLVRG